MRCIMLPVWCWRDAEIVEEAGRVSDVLELAVSFAARPDISARSVVVTIFGDTLTFTSTVDVDASHC